MPITVVGIGYVGLANAVMLAQNNDVMIFDIDIDKVMLVNQQKSPIIDSEIDIYLSTKELKLKATLDKYDAYKAAEIVIIAASTDYDPETNNFNMYRTLSGKRINNTV
ncbi:hypothetical protein JJL53_08285 [Aeromonas media]|uniref:hypothetical protein n=1 Tax=Aeromonas media TaxID=651 RepID=UPI0019116FB0|nr:hypothetical protein [Aeromonas media]QQQ15071.1 hypothetical protein JJL53_08285 [Aeromonas media]